MSVQKLVMCLILSFGILSAAGGQEKQGEQVEVGVNTETIEISTQQAQELAESLNLPEGFAEGAKTNDLFYQMMKKIIGQPLADVTVYTDNVDPSAGGGSGRQNVTVMTWLISIMAGVGLVATALAGVFFLVVGLARSNISGTFAGRNEGGAGWYFGRIGLASVLNMPLSSAGGLAISQVIMLVILLMGIGAGSAVFKESSSRMLTQPLITYSHATVESLYASALRAKMCMTYATYHGFIDPSEAVWTINQPQGFSQSAGGIYDTAVRWFSAESSSFETQYAMYGPAGSCGKIAFDMPRGTEPNIFAENLRNVTVVGVLNAATTGNGDEIDTYIKGRMNAAVYSAIQALSADSALSNSLQDVMEQTTVAGMDAQVPDGLVGAISSSYRQFNDTISNALRDTMQNFSCSEQGGGSDSSYRNGCEYNEQLVESISELGFAVGGSYTWILAERQTQLVDAIEDATNREIELDFDRNLEEWDVEVSDVATISAIFLGRRIEAGLRELASTKSSDLAASLNRSYELSTEDGPVFEALGDTLKNTWRTIIMTGNAATGDWENPEPLIMMRAIGNTMINAPVIIGTLDFASSFIPAGAVKKIGGKLKGKLNGKIKDPRKNKSFVEGVGVGGYMLRLLIDALFFIGVFLAVVVPSIPRGMWNTAIAGYFLSAIMVLAGTPIMIAAKAMDANSEGLIGAARSGYYMAFNLFLRPTLMVTGLIIALAVSRVLSWFWNSIFFETFQMTQSGSGSIASIIGYPMIWGIGTMVIIYKSYGLINDLAATVMKMFGAEGEHSMFNEEADRDRLIAVMAQTSSNIRPSSGIKPKDSNVVAPTVAKDKNRGLD